MAQTNRWLGSSPAVAQVDTFTIAGTPTLADTVSIIIGSVTLTYTVTASDASAGVNQVAANFQAALSACTAGMFQDENWSSTGSSGVITATAATAGKPIIYSTAATGGHTTITAANVTPSSGPNDASIAENWSTNSVPGTNANDNVLIDISGAPDILYGLSAINGTSAYISLTIPASYTGNIGLPLLNTTGSTPYVEYRTRFFPVTSNKPMVIGEGPGTGLTRGYFSTGAILSATIYNTGSSSVTGVPTVNIQGCTSGVLTILNGSVGLAVDDNSTSAVVTTGSIGNGTLTLGTGATITTMTQDGGLMYSYGTVTTLNINANQASALITGNITTITANGLCTVTWVGGGTLTTGNFYGQGQNNSPVFNCSVDPEAKTITNATFYGGSAINDPDKTTTWSNPFNFDQASLNASNVGQRFTIARS